MTTSDLDSTSKNFFFVRRNGLGPLRIGSESTAEEFYSYYVDLTTSYETKFKIILILGLVILFISQMILIPIVFSVHRTNNKVLSLFGYIPIDEINELAGRCERYIQKYLDDYQEKREFSVEKSADDQEGSSKREHNENTYFEVNANESMNPENIKLNISEGEGLEAKVAQYNKDGNNQAAGPNLVVPGEGLQKQGGDKSIQDIDKSGKSMDKSSAIDIKAVKEDEKKNEDEENLAIDRTQKLLNSKDNNKKTVIVQFLAVTMLFAIWFILNYVDITILLSRVRVCLSHLRLLSQRTPDVRFVLAFSLEELAENNNNSVYLYPSKL